MSLLARLANKRFAKTNITEVTAYMLEVRHLRDEVKTAQPDATSYEQIYRTWIVAEAVLERMLEKAEH